MIHHCLTPSRGLNERPNLTSPMCDSPEDPLTPSPENDHPNKPRPDRALSPQSARLLGKRRLVAELEAAQQTRRGRLEQLQYKLENILLMMSVRGIRSSAVSP